MSSHFKTIPVLDGNGDQLTVYEINERVTLFGLVVKKRLELCTGEAITRDGNDFVVTLTGEKLTRIRT